MGIATKMSGSFKDGQSYWDHIYAGDSSEFDWYQQYGHLEQLLNAINNDHVVLIAGAGTSKIGVELADRGVATVKCIEQCQAAVTAMEGKYGRKCDWACGNLTTMQYGTDTFDIVFDKAVLDAMLCQEGGTRISQTYLGQVARVLKPGGKLICISTGKPDIRKSYFTSHFEEVACEDVPKPSTSPVDEYDAPKHYVYVCKGPKSQ